jgi:hypothetical protein
VDVTGAVTIVGALDMDGTARLMLGGDLTLTGELWRMLMETEFIWMEGEHKQFLEQ